MVMKALLFSVFALGALGALHTDQSPPMAGRYQLFNARYDLIGSKQPIIANELFRIDTATGKTWQYQSGILNGDPLLHWAETFEAEELKALKRQRNQGK